MKQKYCTLFALLAFAFASVSAIHGNQNHEGDEHTILTPDEVEWRDGPASLEDGAAMAVLEGDPGAEGIFTMRLRLPEGFQIKPHTHPAVERVTVLEGEFKIGTGREFDEEKLQALGPGSFFRMPPGMEHFASFDEETVIQITGVGPWEIQYIDPEDDPRHTPPVFGERPE